MYVYTWHYVDRQFLPSTVKDRKPTVPSEAIGSTGDVTQLSSTTNLYCNIHSTKLRLLESDHGRKRAHCTEPRNGGQRSVMETQAALHTLHNHMEEPM